MQTKGNLDTKILWHTELDGYYTSCVTLCFIQHFQFSDLNALILLPFSKSTTIFVILSAPSIPTLRNAESQRSVKEEYMTYLGLRQKGVLMDVSEEICIFYFKIDPQNR